MKKISVNMMSSATSIKGQGVGSAYLEQIELIKSMPEKFEVTEGKRVFPDITHYHTLNPDFYLLRKFRTKNGCSVGYVHFLPETVDNSLKLPKLFKKVFYKYMISFYKSMDYLVTVNPYFIGRLAHYGIDKERVTYIPNYVSSEKFHPLPPEEKTALKKKYGLPADRFTVVCAGQLQKRKGVFDFAELARKMPDVNFAWAGGFSFGKMTDGYKEINRLAENPPKNLFLLGMIERGEMNDIYNMGDVMLLPSFEELFPMTILEAMCAHVPILLRDLDIYPDILFDFYQKADSVDGFEKIIGKMMNDGEFYEECVEASCRGNEFYSREHVIEMWDRFYTRVCSESSAERLS